MKMRESLGGGFEGRPGEFFVRCTLAAQQRVGVRAPWATNLAETIERGKVVQAWVNRLRAAGLDREYVDVIFAKGASAPDAAELAKVAAKVEVLVGGHFDRVVAPAPKKGAAGSVTFRTFAERWTSGELARLHPTTST